MLGNCYGATEAVYNLLGGENSCWEVMKINGKPSHWFLRHKTNGTILDVTQAQFKRLPDYTKAKRAALFPKKSKRAEFLESVILWRDNVEKAMEAYNG